MKKDMCTIILDDCNDSSVRFSEINKEDAIFAYKNGVLVGMVGYERGYGFITKIGANCGTNGYSPFLMDCLRLGMKGGLEYKTMRTLG